MTSLSPTIFVVEDDPQVQTAVRWQLSSFGGQLRFFSRPSEILAARPARGPSVLIMDFQLPEMNGLELIEPLRSRGWLAPFIIATGFGDVPRAVDAMRLGAIDFLEKPIEPEKLSDAVKRALEIDQERLERNDQTTSIAKRLDRLTPRESEVLALIVAGKMNKQIAHELGVTIKTVETHRASIMKKMEIHSVAILVRLVVESGVTPPAG